MCPSILSGWRSDGVVRAYKTSPVLLISALISGQVADGPAGPDPQGIAHMMLMNYGRSLTTRKHGSVARRETHSRLLRCRTDAAPPKVLLRFERTREAHQQRCDFAYTTRGFGDRGVKRLLALAEEVIVGSVRHECLVAHIGGGEATVGVGGGRSPFGV